MPGRVHERLDRDHPLQRACDDTLAERGLCWTSGDERSVGVALAQQIGLFRVECGVVGPVLRR